MNSNNIFQDTWQEFYHFMVVKVLDIICSSDAMMMMVTIIWGLQGVVSGVFIRKFEKMLSMILISWFIDLCYLRAWCHPVYIGTFNKWRTVVSWTWKYDDPRLKMSHERAALVWHFQPWVVIISMSHERPCVMFCCMANYNNLEL